MANINSLMTNSSSSTSNLYGTRNVLSGLASGMDTEAMIENSVTGYKTKITQLEQQQTKYEWKQDAYRGITDKLYELTQKYTSYTSKTNLASDAFFSNSITTSAVGTDAAKVSAKGRSSSDIQLLAAKAATAASYSVDASSLGLVKPSTTTGAVETSGSVSVGYLKGSFTLNYDGQSVEISFDESDLINAKDASGNPLNGSMTLAAAITKKLGETTINTSKNGVMKASDVIQVSDAGGTLTFSEKVGNKQGATPYISYIDSNLKANFNVTESKLYEGSGKTVYTIANADKTLGGEKSVKDYLQGRTINLTLDGVNKSFTLDDFGDGAFNAQAIAKAFEAGFKEVGAKIGVEAMSDGTLKFTPPETSTFSISAKDEEANKILGLTNGVGNYISETSSIANLLGSAFSFDPAQAATKAANVEVESVTGAANTYKDSNGNLYELDNGTYYRVNDKNERLFELKINDKSVYVSKDASLQSVLNEINDSKMGVTAAYSKLTGKFTLTAKEAGSAGEIKFGDGLAEKLFTNGTKANQNERTLGEIFGLGANEQVKLSLTSISSGANYKIVTPEGGSSTTFSATATLQDVMNAINTKSAANRISPTISYNSSTGEFSATGLGISNWTITARKDDGTQTALAGTDVFRNYQETGVSAEGADAEIRVSVNGEVQNLTRSSNTIDLDGMSVTLKGDIGVGKEYFSAQARLKELAKQQEDGTLDADGASELAELQRSVGDLETKAAADPLSFTTSGGSEDVIKTIREFVDEYNAAMKQVYDAFATQPAEKSSSSHTKYEPLTDDDKSSMSEKAIENYETKANQGILFGDSDLRGLYQQMMGAIAPGGNDGAALRDMGIETTYSGGVTQLKLNETKLREALESDPDKVRNAFTKSKDYGASSNGLMSSIKAVLDKYASTSIGSPGVLVKKAGSTYSSTSLLSNAVQKQIDSVQTQIQQWQTKMSSKIDYYTRQFTALEKLMNTMNSQSSALSGLMGGY